LLSGTSDNRNARAASQERALSEHGYLLISADGDEFPLRAGLTNIGNDPGNDIVVDDPLASARHATISAHTGRIWITDNDSRSGTFVDGKRISAPHELVPGNTLVIGSTQFSLVAPQQDATEAISSLRPRLHVSAPQIAGLIAGVLLGVLFLLWAPAKTTSQKSLQNAAPSAGEAPSAPLAQSQLVLVIDVSGSMDAYVMTEAAPEEIQELHDQLNRIPNLPEVEALQAEIDAILESPDIKAAGEKRSAFEYARITYIQDELGVNLFDWSTSFMQTMDDSSCEPEVYPSEVLGQESVDHAMSVIQYRCESLSEDTLDDIQHGIAFLDDERVQEMQAEIDALRDEYWDLLEAANYNETSMQLQDIYAEHDYYELSAQWNEKVDQLGVRTRLDFAKSAANSILDLTKLDEQVSGQLHDVAVVAFSTTAKTLRPLSADIEETREVISGLETMTSTNLGEGVDLALDMLDDPEIPATIILLSDGYSNVGPSRDVIHGDITNAAVEKGVNICAAGFGTDEEDVDGELLTSLAENSGGQFLFTSHGGELVSFFIACRQSIAADDVTQFAGSIASGQTRDAGQVEIGSGIGELTIALNYVTGNLELIVLDPDGEQVGEAYPGLTQLTSPGLRLTTIEAPKAGGWTLRVRSSDGSEETGAYHIVVSTKEGLPEGALTDVRLVVTALSALLLLIFAALWVSKSIRKTRS
jgi:hypothetical protein